ncbi:hypothetical protein TrVFT333_010295 [Trichoderma virens FT-333]|nr:hypothetical protein TrVFT333_010295 [Trichoderma virens FT-333]
MFKANLEQEDHSDTTNVHYYNRLAVVPNDATRILEEEDNTWAPLITPTTEQEDNDYSKIDHTEPWQRRQFLDCLPIVDIWMTKSGEELPTRVIVESPGKCGW